MAHSYATNCGPNLVMVLEPETKYRFRYESEGGSHGGLTGKGKEKGKKTFPTVKLMNYSGSYKEVFIRVSLYTENKTEHVMYFKKKKSTDNENYIDEHLKEDFTAEFRNLAILSKLKDASHQILMDRRIKNLGKSLTKTARERFEKENIEDVKKEAREILNSVILRFDAFENGRPPVQICPSLYSDPIYNQKASSKGDLKIHRMSKVSGSCKGDEEVILLCDKVQKDNIKIRFYEHDVEDGWVAYADFKPTDVHYQVAIPFKTPKYKDNVEKKVAVALERQGELSEPRYFTYIAEDSPSKKRKKCVPDILTCPLDISSPCSSSAAFSDDSLKEIMLTPESPQEMFDLQNDNSQNEFLNFKSLEDFMSLELSLGDIGNIHMDSIFESIPDIGSDIEPCYENRVFTDGPVSLITKDVLDITIVEGQMAAIGIEDCTDGHIFTKPNYEATSKSARVSETGKSKLKQYVHLLSKTDESGNTLLHLAILHNKNIGIVMHMNQMTESEVINVQNRNKQTPLHIAVERNADAVKILLLCGGNPNIKNAEGNNCFHIAAENNFGNCMRNLLGYSAFKPDLNEFNYEGLTPLHIAIKRNSLSCFNILRKQADLKAKELRCDRSLLHYAVEFQPDLILPMLEEGEIDVNIQDSEGNTALHIACAIGNCNIVQQLLLAGADPSLRNYKQSFPDSDEENSDSETPAGERPADLTTNSKILELLSQASRKDRSGHVSVKDNSGTSEELMKNLCSILDSNMRWKSAALYVIEEKYIDSLKCSPSPTRALLQYMKKNLGEGYIESLKATLAMVGFDDAVQIIEENKPLIVL